MYIYLYIRYTSHATYSYKAFMVRVRHFCLAQGMFNSCRTFLFCARHFSSLCTQQSVESVGLPWGPTLCCRVNSTAVILCSGCVPAAVIQGLCPKGFGPPQNSSPSQQIQVGAQQTSKSVGSAWEPTLLPATTSFQPKSVNSSWHPTELEVCRLTLAVHIAPDPPQISSPSL